MIHRIMLGLVILSLGACVTPSEKRGMQNDIFNVQTRLLNLERQLSDTGKEAKTSSETTQKSVASTQANLDRITRELQQLHGDVDALRIGVVTGKLPGAESQEGSVADTLAKLAERLDAIEQSQEELLQALKKAGLKNSTKKPKALSNAGDLQSAFDDKKYKQVVDEGPKVLKDAKDGDKEQVRFLLAESYFKLGRMREAALKYNDFIDSKPTNKYLPLAKMRIGDCFRNLGDASTARVYYEELIKEFPNSEEAAKAKERLAGDSGKADGPEKG